MDALFAPLGMSVTHIEPAGDVFHSTIFFNTDSAGTSDGVDFRNLTVTDNAELNARILLDFVGVPLAEMTAEKIVRTSINTAMHEALHLVGARHHDAFAPFSMGVSTSGVAERFDPDYPGPRLASLTNDTFMSLTLALSGINETALLRDAR